MATYYEIHGQKVKYLSSDPSPVTEGQVWYNSSTGALLCVVASGALFASTPQLVGGYSQGSAGT